MNHPKRYETTDYPNNDEYAYYINQYHNYYNDIISKMCHELNNQLTLINSALQLIELKHPEINDIKYWNSLTNDVQEGIELLNNFKDFRDHTDIKISNNDLLKVIESAVNSLLPIAEEKNIPLSLWVDEDCKSHYLNYPFDKHKIKSAFINIIKNALEATSDGGYVIIHCSSDDTNLIIEIKDNGTPISVESKENIFDLRVTSKSNGYGLGLPIARSSILSHLGKIDITSDETETNFKVFLPKH